MSKLWLVEVKREIADDNVIVHMRQDTKPTQEEVVKFLCEEHYINDDPKYTRYIVSEVTE